MIVVHENGTKININKVNCKIIGWIYINRKKRQPYCIKEWTVDDPDSENADQHCGKIVII